MDDSDPPPHSSPQKPLFLYQQHLNAKWMAKQPPYTNCSEPPGPQNSMLCANATASSNGSPSNDNELLPPTKTHHALLPFPHCTHSNHAVCAPLPRFDIAPYKAIWSSLAANTTTMMMTSSIQQLAPHSMNDQASQPHYLTSYPPLQKPMHPPLNKLQQQWWCQCSPHSPYWKIHCLIMENKIHRSHHTTASTLPQNHHWPRSSTPCQWPQDSQSTSCLPPSTDLDELTAKVCNFAINDHNDADITNANNSVA